MIFVTNKQICFVKIVYICIIALVDCFCSAVIILFINLESSLVQAWFYILFFLHQVWRFLSRDVVLEFSGSHPIHIYKAAGAMA